MINLNECKFGDRLKMRNGKMAIYVGKEPHCISHFLVMEIIEFGYGMLYASDMELWIILLKEVMT